MSKRNSVSSRDDRVVAAAVRAAYAWSVRDEYDRDAMTEICQMTGVIAEAHGPGRSPAGPMDLVAALREPLGELLLDPASSDIASVRLLDADTLSDEVYDLAAEYAGASDRIGTKSEKWLPRWTRMRAERVSQEVFKTLIEAGDQDIYVSSRRFIIEHPTGEAAVIADDRVKAGARPAGDYAPLRAHQTFDGQFWWPCPVCKYPMTVDSDEVRCPYRWHQARFPLDRTSRQPRISANRIHRAPASQLSSGIECVEPAVWRSIVVPGVSELRIAEKLRKYSEVCLWPDFDTYDLHVVTGDFRYDVKEYASVQRLIDRLRERPAAAAILIPQTHFGQVKELKDAGFTAVSERSAVQLACRAAEEAR